MDIWILINFSGYTQPELLLFGSFQAFRAPYRPKTFASGKFTSASADDHNFTHVGTLNKYHRELAHEILSSFLCGWMPAAVRAFFLVARFPIGAGIQNMKLGFRDRWQFHSFENLFKIRHSLILHSHSPFLLIQLTIMIHD